MANAVESPAPQQSGLKFKLSLMMFLEIFIWGAWFPLAYRYLSGLGFSDAEKGWIMNAFALASITAMFFSNQFADRNFAAQKFLAFSHLVGGLAIMMIGVLEVNTFWPFFGLLLVHSLFYIPTISITNSIAFANLADPQRDFSRIRLWGTIGWILASLPFVFILANWAKVQSMGEVGFVDWLGQALSASYDLSVPAERFAFFSGVRWTYIVAGIASLMLAGFSLSLPHTPPRPAKSEDSRFAWLEAGRFLAKPFILILFVATFVDATVHQGYFLLTANYLELQVGIPGQWIMPVMSIGQIAEILTMFMLGYVLKTLGWRMTMIVGILGHTARFMVFAYYPEMAPAVLIQVLHGICYAFFFATVYIFVDEFFPKDARVSAQGLFNLLILGLGPLAGNFLWPYLEGMFTTRHTSVEQLALAGRSAVFGVDYTVNYQGLFLVPALSALAAAVMLLLFFHPPKSAPPKDEEAFPQTVH